VTAQIGHPHNSHVHQCSPMKKKHIQTLWLYELCVGLTQDSKGYEMTVKNMRSVDATTV